MSSFRYTHAIVCRIPESYQTHNDNIDLPMARKQHEGYVAALREIGLDVIELAADENHPNCVFVEDIAVVCNGSALLTRPGNPDRAKEVEYMRSILQNELALPLIEISNEKANIDGGDVLFTGKEFFVGLSDRTNQAGACALAAAFPEFPCTPIKVENALHLKSVMSMAGPDVIAVANSPEARDMLKRIEREATFRYQILTVPDSDAANCVFANGFLLHRSSEECPDSAKVYGEKLGHWTLKPIDFSELQKSHGYLSSASILIRKTRHLKNIM